MKRTVLVNGAAVELAATALGILFARGILTMEQRDAGERYARLHRATFGPSWTQQCLLADADGGLIISDERLARLRAALDELDGRLTVEQKRAVQSAAVYGQIPTWFFAARLRLYELPEDRVEREALIGGLDQLAKPIEMPAERPYAEDAADRRDRAYIDGDRLRAERLRTNP